MLDDCKPHPSISHLGDRLHHVIVHDDMTISESQLANGVAETAGAGTGRHGLSLLLMAAHAPFDIAGKPYVSLAPAATYVFLTVNAHKAEERHVAIGAGINWIIQQRQEWNLRIVLFFSMLGPLRGGIHRSSDMPMFHALRPALDQGMLIIMPHSNTPFGNDLPPIECLAVGGYDDRGSTDTAIHRPYVDSQWGENGEGHFRPDVLAPMFRIPVPFDPYTGKQGDPESLGWTCGAAALVAGLSANILSRHPTINASTLRHALVDFGLPIPQSENPTPRVCAEASLRAIVEGSVDSSPFVSDSRIAVAATADALHADDPITRGVALTQAVLAGQCDRQTLWSYVGDPSPRVRIVAISALADPLNQEERGQYWTCMKAEHDIGARCCWASNLVRTIVVEEASLWRYFANDTSPGILRCVKWFLSKVDPTVIYSLKQETGMPD
jgi:serine protease AprX